MDKEFGVKVLNDVAKLYHKCVEDEYNHESEMLDDILDILQYVNSYVEKD